MIRKIKIYTIVLLLICVGMHWLSARTVGNDGFTINIEDNNVYQGAVLEGVTIWDSYPVIPDTPEPQIADPKEGLDGSLVGTGAGLSSGTDGGNGSTSDSGNGGSSDGGSSNDGLSGFEDLLIDYTNSTESSQPEADDTNDPKDPEPQDTVPKDTNKCTGIKCPICGGYYSLPILKEANLNCPTCTCKPCVRLEPMVTDQFNNMYTIGTLASLGNYALAGSSLQYSSLITYVNDNQSLITLPAAGSLTNALSTNSTANLIAAAYNQTGGSNATFTNQQVLEFLTDKSGIGNIANFQTVYLIGSQSIYALVLQNSSNSSILATDFANMLNADGSFKTNSQAGIDYADVYKFIMDQHGKNSAYNDYADAMAKAYTYYKNVGLSLLEADGTRDKQGNLVWGETAGQNGDAAIKTLNLSFKQIIPNVTLDGNGNVINVDKIDCSGNIINK